MKGSPQRSLAPRSMLVLRPDTLGDLVLFSPALRLIQEAWPETLISVLVRRPYVELARLLAPGAKWMPTTIDPFVQGPAESEAELAKLAGEIADLDPELVVAACFRRSWLDTRVASSAPRARRVAFASNAEDPFFGLQVRQALGGAAGAGFEEVAPAAAGEQDWRRNFGLADYLLGTKNTPSVPELSIGPDLLARADDILRGLGLEPGRFVACAAAGFAHVRIKTWPAERFARTLGWLRRDQGVRTLLVGQQSERGYLEALARDAGAAEARVWLGGESDLPLLAAILARSSMFFGNDTGALHLAASLSRSIVGIYGGGTWPRFQPAARKGIALVHPLPCFGCGWDCAFGDAPCVSAISEDDVRRALSDVIRELPVVAAASGTSVRHAAADGCEVREVYSLPEPVVALMGKAAAVSRERTAAHLERELKLEEIGFLAGQKDGEIRSLKAILDRRERDLATKETEIGEKEAEIDAKEAEIHSKELEIHAKEAEIHAKESEIDAKEAEIGRKQAEIDSLARVCKERLDLIVRLDKDLKGCAAEIERLRREVSASRRS